MVVLGGSNQDAVAGGHPSLECSHGRDAGLCIQVLVVEGNVFQCNDLKIDLRGHSFCQNFQDSRAEGRGPKAAREAQDSDALLLFLNCHRLLHFSTALSAVDGSKLGRKQHQVKRYVLISPIIEGDESKEQKWNFVTLGI